MNRGSVFACRKSRLSRKNHGNALRRYSVNVYRIMTPLPSPVVMIGIAGGVFAGIEDGIPPLRRNIRLGAGGLDLLEFPCRVRFAAAGIDRLDQNFVFVHKPLHSFLVSVFSIPQAVQSMQE